MSTSEGADARLKLIAGCPVSARAWIIDRWFEHLHVAADRAGLLPVVVLLGPRGDPTFDRAEVASIEHGLPLIGLDSGEPRRPGPTDSQGPWRRWSPQRLAHMVRLRNRLLAEVRSHSPQYFLSVDSDVLLHRMSLVHLFETIEDGAFAAVGGGTNMTATETTVPSFAVLSDTGRLLRPKGAFVRRVDVLMAVKLMTPVAYSVDYRFDTRGEDVGWSNACRHAGLTLGWDGRVMSDHVMDKGDG